MVKQNIPDSSVGRWKGALWPALSVALGGLVMFFFYLNHIGGLPSWLKPSESREPAPVPFAGYRVPSTYKPPVQISVDIDDLSSPTVENSGGRDSYSLKGNSISLHGTVSPNVTKIVVAYVTGQEEHELTRFKPGDTKWDYNARIYLGNLRRGENVYEIRAYVDDEQAPATERVYVNADVYRDEVPQDTGAILVEWLPAPESVATSGFLKELPMRQEGIDLIMNYESPFGGRPQSGMTLTQQLDALLTIHKSGTVTEGYYAGDTVYHIQMNQEGMCGGDPNNYHRILRSPDGRLTFLSKYSDSVDARLYELLPFVVDKKVTMNLLPPDELGIPNSPLTLKKKFSYNNLASFTKAEPLFYSEEAGMQIFRDSIQCYAAQHKDGTYSTYLLNLPTRAPTGDQKAKAEETAQYTRSGEGILDITWKNGKKNTTQYVSRDIFGGMDLGCSYMTVDVVDGKIPTTKDYVGGPLEEIGTAAWGEPVYREVYGKKQLLTYGSGSVPQGNHRLFQAYDRFYRSENKPSILEFYDQYPIIFVRDPFGKYLQFTDMTVIPSAEKCKPVIYLYPEKETDVSVRVAPTGGISLSIPDYRDGWSVRAFPDGTIWNYADMTEYPYLFWEGFGSPGYRMHDQGFVLKREEIPCRLPALLSAQGLRGQEITDFMEYWAPKFREKPYYYVTFTPQEEFEKEAPLTIDPKPDSVIRVFMDYQGLDEPLQVKPQQFSPPARTGFTVIEWGGAKR
ncbi:MAG: hypothetical protein PHZ00_02365 [Candidatus Peribacteraceae bacterium]|nr:hypothetical protein [Candidatus Peribacteraceae bacterium]